MERSEFNDYATAPTRRVLLLGSEADTNVATERYLQYCGHEVSLAEDPERAVAEADRLKPQVLVCDVGLKSGRERVSAAMKIQQSHDAALVVVTNYHRAELRRQFPSLRVADYLRKPISLRLLEKSVSRVPAPR